MRLLILTLVAMLALAGAAPAQTTIGLEIDLTKDQDYHLQVVNGKVTVRPFQVIRLGTTPTPPPVDPDGPPGTPEQEIAAWTKAALSSGGKPTTAVAIATVYSAVGDGVADGSIALDRWSEAVQAATDRIFDIVTDDPAWAKFRKDVGATLTIMRDKGMLGTKEQVAAALRSISTGIRQGAGLATWKHDDIINFKASHIREWDTTQGSKADGFLDGVDLAQLIELIKLIMDLLKVFGVGK
jgi:hypothetical protein